MSDTSWLDTLNQQQFEAVTYRAAPLLVLAGPGSGKTRILTSRIAWLVREREATPESILAVTFTNRAAEEMRERLAAVLGDDASRIWVYTFHAAAVRILRRFGARAGIDPNFAIIDEDEQRHAFNRLLRQQDLSREHYPLNRVGDYISRRKNALGAGTPPDEGQDPALVELAGAYEAWLYARKALDFDDLIRYTVGLLRQDSETRQHYHRSLRHILVDEYQDIDGAQYELLKLLAQPDASVTVVADDDQSIYGWRGSRPELIDDFIARYSPHIVKLETSYRCPPNILYGAQRLIAHQRSQERQRFMRSEAEGEALIFHYMFQNIRQEQRWLKTLVGKLIEERGYKPGDIGILYRTHRLAPAVEHALLNAGYKVHRLRKESFFDEPVAREVIRYLHLVRALRDEYFSSAMNYPIRLVDELTMLQLRRLTETSGIGLVELARRVQHYSEISPLTGTHLTRFLSLVEARLPDPRDDVSEGLEALFALLDDLRSPWREQDRELLEGFMAFTELPQQVQALATAVDAGRPLHLLHPSTLDGYAAAQIIRRTLSVYFGVVIEGASVAEVGEMGEDVLLVILGDLTPPPGPQEQIRLGGAGEPSYALATYAWRCMQALLVSYETLAEGRFVIYDVETTGTNIRRDEIVELAAVLYEQQRPAGEPFHSMVRPQRGYIPRAATAVHGIRYREVVDAPELPQVLPDFLDYVGDETVVGHNISRFDNRFIDRACGELLGGRGFNPPFLDTLRLARRLLPDLGRYSLEALLAELGVGDTVAHRAQRDIDSTAEVFFHLTDRILDEKEREALAEFLPLVGLAILAEGKTPVDETLSLLHGAARSLASERGRAEAQDFLATLPAHLHDQARPLLDRLQAWPLPQTEEDEAWADLQETFFQHVEAFKAYSADTSLAAFLDYQALLSNIDTFSHVQDEDHITMMTLHNAKGAEFPVVIIVGVEQENLPLWHTLNDPEQMAEERRVFYVGLTRAREAVYLFSTRNRRDGFRRSPSRFAFEIPSEYIRRFQIDGRDRVRELT